MILEKLVSVINNEPLAAGLLLSLSIWGGLKYVEAWRDINYRVDKEMKHDKKT